MRKEDYLEIKYAPNGELGKKLYPYVKAAGSMNVVFSKFMPERHAAIQIGRGIFSPSAVINLSPH